MDPKQEGLGRFDGTAPTVRAPAVSISCNHPLRRFLGGGVSGPQGQWAPLSLPGARDIIQEGRSIPFVS